MELKFFPGKAEVIKKLESIKGLILDFDGTLVDYKLNQKDALYDLFDYYKLSNDMYSEAEIYYSQINEMLWKKFERQEIGMEEIRKIRFEKLFKKFELQGDPFIANDFYLTKFVERVPKDLKAINSLEKLRKQFPWLKIVLLSNGADKIQHQRITNLKINNFFDGIYTSGSLGFSKPDKRAFSFVIKKLKISKDELWMVGDSMTSDIQGAKNAGISSVLIEYASVVSNDHNLIPNIIVPHLSNFVDFLFSILKYNAK